MHIPLTTEKDKRVKRSEFAAFLARPSIERVEEVKERLIKRMLKKIDEHKKELESQLVHGKYSTRNWRKIDRLEGEVERIKGAVAVLRWATGETEAIDLEIPGYLVVSGNMLEHDEDA